MEHSSIVIAGDFFLHSEAEIQANSFLIPTEFLKSYKVFALNLEGPICRCSDVKPLEKFSALRMEPSIIMILKRLGINVAFLANNHVADYGEEGIVETIEILRKNGIEIVGAGSNIEEAFRPLIFELNKVRVGLINFTTVFTLQSRATAGKAGVAGVRMITNIKITPYELFEEPGAPYVVDAEPFQEDFELVIKNIRNLRKDVDLLITYVHWGIGALPFSSIILEYQRKLGRILIDVGSDLVIGSHPHILLPAERYNGKLIIYSLGNFVFSHKDPRLIFSEVGGILSLDISEKIVKIMPICLDMRGFPGLCKKPYEKIHDLSSFISRSEKLGVRIEELGGGWFALL